MTLASLATFSDLADRGISVPDSVNAQALLDAASAAVRDAAGCQITYGTSTVVLVAHDPYEIDLPAGPLASVASVTVGGVAVTGWSTIGDTLLMPRTRWTDCLPAAVTVTYDHGYQIIPADIIDLVCAVVGMAAVGADDGYGSAGRLDSFRLSEYSEKYVHPAGTESLSPVALPDSVRQRLRARFGSSVALVRMS